MSIDFSKLPIGTKVYWADLEGEITSINYSGLFFVKVAFDAGRLGSFTKDGRIWENLPPVLALKPYSIPAECLELPRPDLEVDAPILVRDCLEDGWLRKYFKQWTPDGVECWVEGKTSWTARGRYYSWNFWKLPTEDDK